MTGKELRKLGRPQLLELLVAQAKETEELKKRLAKAEEQLAKRRIAIDEAGSIAEASWPSAEFLRRRRKRLPCIWRISGN